MKVKYLLFILAGLLMLSCAIAEGPREKLSRSTFSFNEGLRWGRYNDVLPFVDSKALDHFMEIHKDWGKNVKISSAEMVSTTYDKVNKKAKIAVNYTWYRSNEMVVHNTTTVQNWEYVTGTWMMIAEEHQSGEPF